MRTDHSLVFGVSDYPYKVVAFLLLNPPLPTCMTRPREIRDSHNLQQFVVYIEHVFTVWGAAT